MFWANGLRFEIVEDKFRKSPDKEIKLPKRASKGSMAYDFFSPGDFSLYPNETCMIWTDIKVRMPDGIGLMLNVRSAWARLELDWQIHKDGLILIFTTILTMAETLESF